MSPLPSLFVREAVWFWAEAVSPFLRDEVLAALREAGVQSEFVEQTHITVQSQETVDRDYESNWSYAMT